MLTITQLSNNKLFVNIKYLVIDSKLVLEISLIYYWLIYKTNYYLL